VGLADPADVTREQATRKLEEASRRSSLSLSIFLLLVGLSHVGFHAVLYVGAGRAKERIAERDARAYEQDGDWSRKRADELLRSDRAFQTHLRERALLETAEQRHRLVYGMLLGAVVALFALGARESPLTVSTITLLCLTGLVAISISIPFVDYAVTGGFLYLVSIAVECAALVVWMFQPLLAKGPRG
jgi:hypothetical protein